LSTVSSSFLPLTTIFGGDPLFPILIAISSAVDDLVDAFSIGLVAAKTSPAEL
jgi:hypothetical protein